MQNQFFLLKNKDYLFVAIFSPFCLKNVNQFNSHNLCLILFRLRLEAIIFYGHL